MEWTERGIGELTVNLVSQWITTEIKTDLYGVSLNDANNTMTSFVVRECRGGDYGKN